MGIFDLFKKKETEQQKEIITEPKSDYKISSDVVYGPSWAIVDQKWDGEKTLGELGVVINNIPDYKRLRLRAYDAEMKIDAISIIVSKYFKWVVGSGLKLQSEPNKSFLSLEGVSVSDNFSRDIEARFSVWAKSTYSDYSRQVNLHAKALECFSNAFLGGDCLVYCRIDDYGLNVQVIDGQHISTPNQDMLDKVKKRGNFEDHGIEYNSRGEHIAYFVKSKKLKKEFDVFDEEFTRITVYGEQSKRKLAWIVYGKKHRIDHKRGITRLSHVLEKVNKLDRYAESTVSKSEQSAKIVNFIEHSSDSTGENIMEAIKSAKINLVGSEEENESSYYLGDELAKRVYQTTSNQTFNMPIGSKMVPYQSNAENNFDAFYSAVFSGIAASLDTPPEVAMQKYSSNYSASRAAINGWGYIIDIERDKLVFDFYKPIYGLFLEIQVLMGKIQAPKFIESLKNEDYMITEAYKNCRFIGKNMPHIDPLKEVKAVSEMLNKDLINREQATELLNMGDWNENYTKKKEEDKLITPKPIENGNTANANG